MKRSERWVPVLGWECHYEVSNDGQVRSCRTGRTLKPGRSGNVGYLAVILWINAGKPNERKKNAKIHRIVLESFTGLKPIGRQTCAAHLNGNHLDNRWPENLYWASRLQNEADKDRHGRRPIGEKSVKAKLTEVEVRLIHKLSHEGVKLRTLSKRFAISGCHVSMIRDEKTWRHLWK